MSEKTKPANKKLITLAVVAFIVLSGIYLAGNFILPNAIKSSYQAKNCEQVLSLDNFYVSIYPAPIADQSIAALTSECALYALAVETEGKKTATWQDVYNAYKAYMDQYPNGPLFSDAQEHGALALTALAKEQLGAKRYTEALAAIGTIQQSFGKTNAAKEAASLTSEIHLAVAKDQLAAKEYTNAIETINLVLQGSDGASASNNAASLISEVYTAWAKDQRDSDDFAGAETTLKAFKTWAERAKKADAIKSAQGELAQTYLAWGLDFQNQKQFENAKAQFDQAISNDPDPSVATGPAAQAKSAQIKMYTIWGDSFIEKNDFDNAIKRYEIVVSLSEAKDQPAAKDQISGIYLKWTTNLSSSDDFIGALKTVEQAKEVAATDSAKKQAETTQADVYQAFSQSSGEQAQQAMTETAKKVCLNEQPTLPIFGTDSNTIHAYLYIPGNESNLTDAVKATTPASLHYVACVTEKSKSDPIMKSTNTDKQGRSITGSYYTIERITNYWDIQLYDIKTGKMAASQLFAGSAPPSWGYIRTYTNNNYIVGSIAFAGTMPSLETVSAWVEKYMK